jgi:hypothetical protein
VRGGWVLNRGVCAESLVVRRKLGGEPPALTEDEIAASFDPLWVDPFVDREIESRRGKMPFAPEGGFEVKPGETVNDCSLVVVRSGWPFPCLCGRTMTASTAIWGAGGAPPKTSTTTVNSSMFIAYPEGTKGYMPYSPLPGPLVADTLVFAAVLWLLVFVPRAIVRESRAAGVRCRECGYKLRSRVAVCPECGKGGRTK